MITQTVCAKPRFAILCLAFCSIAGAQKLPFDSQALMQVARIDDPQLAPDGRNVAFTVQTIDLEGNKKPKQIYTVPMDGGTPRPLTNAGESSERARWSPEDRKSTRLNSSHLVISYAVF